MKTWNIPPNALQATPGSAFLCFLDLRPGVARLGFRRTYLMRYAYEHREEGKALGQKAARVAREQWTWKHAAKKLASLFSVPIPVPEHEAACHVEASC